MFASLLAARNPDALNSVPVTGGVAVTLIADQILARSIQFTGALTANIIVYFPLASTDAGAWWIIDNDTSGSFSITVTPTPSGSGIAVAQGKVALIRWDGTNLVSAVNDCVAMGSAASGSNSDITALLGITGGITASGGMALSGGLVLAGGVTGSSAGSDPFKYGQLSRAVAGSVSLTAAEYSKPWHLFTGSAGAQVITYPNAPGAVWVVENTTNGTLTLQTSGQASPPTLATGLRILIGCNAAGAIQKLCTPI